MNILEGVKPSNSHKNTNTKFIIKSKPSTKENKITIEQDTDVYANNADIHQFITYMVAKSKHFEEFLLSKGIEDQADFADKHLFANPSIRTLLKSIMDKMLTDRRIGKNLKGINKGILQQIETGIWSNLERQATLYQLNKIYNQEKSNLEAQIANRRKEIQKQIEALSTGPLQQNLLQPVCQNQASS